MKMKYDTNTLAGKIAVMAEFAKSGGGFCRYKDPKLKEWNGINNPSWNWADVDYNYPAEPEPPKLVPWTLETCPKGAVMLKHEGAAGFDLIAAWLPDGVLKGGGYTMIRWVTLLTYYTHSLDGRTWLPCGTEEKR